MREKNNKRQKIKKNKRKDKEEEEKRKLDELEFEGEEDTKNVTILTQMNQSRHSNSMRFDDSSIMQG